MVETSTKSTAELISEALDDFTALLRKELELARIGVVEAVTGRLKGAALIAGAVVAVLPALLFLIVALALWLPVSAAAGFLIVGGALVLLMAPAVIFGIRLVKKGGKGSREVLDHVKEDAAWARRRLTH
jgi:putative superfamily III holin-X